jgi:hypothetical protein
MNKCFGCNRRAPIPITCIWCKNICCSKCTQIEIHKCPEKLKKIENEIENIKLKNQKISPASKTI